MKIVETDASARLLRHCVLAMALSLAVAPQDATAQGLVSGAVAVQVTDAAGQPVTEVLVTLADSASGITHTATADRVGRHRFGIVTPGEYSLTVERIGFEPRRLNGVVVRPEMEVSLDVALTRQGSSAPRLIQEAVNAGSASPIMAREWLPSTVWRWLPGRSRDVNGLTRFSSIVSDGFVVEGLPGTLSSLAIDGTPFRAVSHASIGEGASAFALGGFDAAQVLANPVDVEWSDAAGAILSTYSHRGSRLGAGGVLGSFSGDAMSISSLEGGTSYTDLQGGVSVDGGLAGGNGRFAIGVQGISTGTPLSAAWTPGGAAGDVVAVDPSLVQYGEMAVRRDNVISGFAHVDWPASAAHTIEAGVHAAVLPEIAALESGTGALSVLEGSDFLANIALRSVLGERTRNEAAISLSGSRRAHVIDDEDPGPFTRIVSDALAFGSDAWLESSREARFRISDALFFESGSHLLKLGGSVALGGFEFEPRAGDARSGEYLFGSTDLFAARTGVFARTEGEPTLAEWTDRTFALFAQDRIRIRDGADLVLGVRFERQAFDVDVDLEGDWFARTSIANDEFAGPAMHVSPRIGLNWDIGNTHRYFLNAAAGIYYDRVDPLMIAMWASDDGHSFVRRAIGTFPSGTPTGTTARRLSVLGPDFEAPRTLRASAGFATRVLNGMTVYVGGTARRTEYLPRRTDINLLQLPFAHDQYGRPVFGDLEKQGGLIAAAPGTNRRFPDYDEVTAVSSDGVSNHIGFTAGFEYEAAQRLSLLARYAFGSTTDNWFGGAQGGWTQAPSAGTATPEWLEGTSDFDVPHRVVVGGVITGPIGIRIGASWRLQSGRPFTPGFRPGVDANGDGYSTNDPAFVDPSVPGMAELIARESCLAESASAFAVRNSCRGPIVQGLDASVAIPVLTMGGGTAMLLVDAFNLLESGADVPDAALYLVDPDAALIEEPTDRIVVVPLIANPDFGTPLSRRAPGRTIRVGLSFNW